MALPIDSTQSADLAGYYRDINNGLTELKPSMEYSRQNKMFNSQETKTPVKGYIFGNNDVGSGNNYYSLGHFTKNNTTYNLIIYNKKGEADTLLLNVQLNSYDAKGDLVDALLLSSFFSYEGMDCFSKFIIHSNNIIDIDNYVIYRYEEGDENNLGKPITNPIAQVYLKEKYQIHKGRFTLIYRKSISRK